MTTHHIQSEWLFDFILYRKPFTSIPNCCMRIADHRIWKENCGVDNVERLVICQEFSQGIRYLRDQLFKYEIRSAEIQLLKKWSLVDPLITLGGKIRSRFWKQFNPFSNVWRSKRLWQSCEYRRKNGRYKVSTEIITKISTGLSSSDDTNSPYGENPQL